MKYEAYYKTETGFVSIGTNRRAAFEPAILDAGYDPAKALRIHDVMPGRGTGLDIRYVSGSWDRANKVAVQHFDIVAK